MKTQFLLSRTGILPAPFFSRIELQNVNMAITILPSFAVLPTSYPFPIYILIYICLIIKEFLFLKCPRTLSLFTIHTLYKIVTTYILLNLCLALCSSYALHTASWPPSLDCTFLWFVTQKHNPYAVARHLLLSLQSSRQQRQTQCQGPPSSSSLPSHMMFFHSCGAVTYVRWETLSLAAEEATDKNSEESPVRMCQCGLQRDHFLKFLKGQVNLRKDNKLILTSETSQEVQSTRDVLITVFKDTAHTTENWNIIAKRWIEVDG